MDSHGAPARLNEVFNVTGAGAESFLEIEVGHAGAIWCRLSNLTTTSNLTKSFNDLPALLLIFSLTMGKLCRYDTSTPTRSGTPGGSA